MPVTLTEKLCLECGEPIKGRTDKKFCSDACRNIYHYHANNAPINYVRNVVNILKRNRRVLSELNTGSEGTKKVHRDKLVERGYNFMYHTNTYRTKAGNTYVFCFEHGYLELSENWFTLVRRDEYLERSGDVKPDWPELSSQPRSAGSRPRSSTRQRQQAPRSRSVLLLRGSDPRCDDLPWRFE
jgi:hypothetical protein